LFIDLLFKLGIVHAVTDLALQGPQFGGKGPPDKRWPYILTAHALVNSGGVLVVTGSSWLAFGEFCWHFLTDLYSTQMYYRTGKSNLHLDQLSHAASKCVWAFLGAN